ncbi:MAG: response regulator transcription factor [Egibacteraceae bacterium]
MLTRVLIADAQVLFSDALAIALGCCEGLEILPDLPTEGRKAVAMAIADKPDIILVDYWMPEMDGPAVARTLAVQATETKVMHLSWFHGPIQIQESLASGAVGFLPKSVRVSLVAEAIVRAQAGESPVFEEQLQGLARTIATRQQYLADMQTRLASLTPRQLEILRLVGAGLMVTDVAKRLGLREGTVRTHIHNILDKTGARSQLEAVALARDEGLIP